MKLPPPLFKLIKESRLNITEELISTLAEMTPKEFNFYVAMME
jgi:hypothetical protein